MILQDDDMLRQMRALYTRSNKFYNASFIIVLLTLN